MGIYYFLRLQGKHEQSRERIWGFGGYDHEHVLSFGTYGTVVTGLLAILLVIT